MPWPREVPFFPRFRPQPPLAPGNLSGRQLVLACQSGRLTVSLELSLRRIERQFEGTLANRFVQRAPIIGRFAFL